MQVFRKCELGEEDELELIYTSTEDREYLSAPTGSHRTFYDKIVNDYRTHMHETTHLCDTQHYKRNTKTSEIVDVQCIAKPSERQEFELSQSHGKRERW